MSFNLEDTCLDTPQAKDIFQKQVASAMADGWLDADWEANPSGNITEQQHYSNKNTNINKAESMARTFSQEQVAAVVAGG